MNAKEARALTDKSNIEQFASNMKYLLETSIPSTAKKGESEYYIGRADYIGNDEIKKLKELGYKVRSDRGGALTIEW